ncbi:helix-turn-helix transcriptional regulator [Ensifer sp. YR511]|uniref:ArsR/SmtB family transcription factor n=1 Tax=Ensifer sp. YR511 TaxID=1855294 RepID=UPI00088ECED5|nr:ArsR family transcriptional regulator [Ensifer sp. YR511]SDN05204.1 DNA-binding transcriptional regulator, ArsR family [Ensifer sp. YR511]
MTICFWNEDNASEAARLLQVIAHPKRLLLLSILVERQLSASKLAAAIGISQPTVFRHLYRLEDLGLISINSSTSSMTFAIASPETVELLKVVKLALAG